ncbi:thermonuclease family protein [Kordiimonas sp. SCSIO 12610]|uniref:thermonuclease family protein n=1 Tax=Kordiimonas sp. SCSIO 12610 TaxID=2829597 RepID=UPI00210C1463|nr:thermonuclease family protein [Kordiimonas sp. SCSIO 12610]UTW55395.1 thermonuclease family protein [Kordiimonas sp. SCSIO 12610]
MSFQITAQELDTSGLSACGSTKSIHSISGDSFKTEEIGKVSLDLLIAPKLWEDIAAYTSWPHATVSREYLNELLQGQNLKLYCDKRARDHRSVVRAHVLREDKVWVQYEMVKSGHAILYPHPSSAFIDTPEYQAIQKTERVARENRLGLWKLDAYQTINAENIKLLSNRTGQFLFVRGSVSSAAKVRKTIYLNFGDNWRRDFTVEIDEKTLKLFEKTNINPLTLENTIIEVRGWVDYKGGPRLELLSPAHLTIVKELE